MLYELIDHAAAPGFRGEPGRGEQIGSATDIFSLGIISYELATGKHPFMADSQIGIMNAILSQPLILPSRLNPEIPPALEALILKMLEKDWRLRPSAAEARAALAELAGSGSAMAARAAALPALPLPAVSRGWYP